MSKILALLLSKQIYRNDNGQSDPSISSLYDFTNGVLGLLGQQFVEGYLNTDRRQVWQSLWFIRDS